MCKDKRRKLTDKETKELTNTMIKDAMSEKLFGIAYSEAIKTNKCVACKNNNIEDRLYDKDSGLCLSCINRRNAVTGRL